MGRLFVIDLEEPVYRCKHCHAEFAAYEDPITRMPVLVEYPVMHGKLYYFSKCFNVVVGTNEVMIEKTGDENGNPMFEVFCICCGSHIGLKYVGVVMYNEGVEIVKYNEGNFLINRFKLNGPPNGSEDDAIQEAIMTRFQDPRKKKNSVIEECRAGFPLCLLHLCAVVKA